MSHNAARSYHSVDKQTMSGRDTEARGLTQGALKLIDCQKNWNAPDHKSRLESALKYNQRIWSIFQVEMTKADNLLPRDIRHNILLLSRFIDKRIFDSLAFPDPGKLNAIIRINQNTAAGLRGSASGPIY